MGRLTDADLRGVLMGYYCPAGDGRPDVPVTEAGRRRRVLQVAARFGLEVAVVETIVYGKAGTGLATEIEES